MSVPTDIARSAPIILDCTVRDGSYAIDFKFTARDTALIARLLDAAGIRYIEIGHGLGLGAAAAGKGAAASTDLEVIERTREEVRSARIGAFFIPGIGDERHLEAAASAGLDFVRIGQDADRIATVWPFVEAARELGLEVFVNFMKTYGVSPEEFAGRACEAARLGAAGVYVVDSAGGMLPREVTRYVETSLAACDLPVGFHGHSNLHLAVANSLAAYEAGATFIDTSLYGIGRSSGNAPTEVIAAILERTCAAGAPDALHLIEIAESYLRPLAEHLEPHTMLAVSMGFGRMHSSFLPRVLDAADKASVSPFRLIVELGRRNVMNVPDELLRDVLADLAGQSLQVDVRTELATFSGERFGPRWIRNRPQAVAELLDDLEVVAAKRHLKIVLDLAFAESLDDAVTAEFVLDDGSMALGRLRYGSPDALAEALSERGKRIGLALVDLRGLSPTAGRRVVRAVGRLVPGGALGYSSADLELSYLAETALAAIGRSDSDAPIALADPGAYDSREVGLLAARLEAAASVRRVGADLPQEGVGLAVVAGPAGSLRAAGEGRGAETTIFIGGSPAVAQGSTNAVVLSRADAYRHCLPRWLAAVAAARAAGTSLGARLAA